MAVISLKYAFIQGSQDFVFVRVTARKQKDDNHTVKNGTEIDGLGSPCSLQYY